MTEFPADWREGSKEFGKWLHTLPDDEAKRIVSIMSLHKYFFWADEIGRQLAKLGKEELFAQIGRTGENDSREEVVKLAFIASMAYPYMAYAYGGLYVVIEGWKELGLSDPKIDELLKSPHVDLLRRYRNAAFHYQTDFLDNRFMEFIVSADSETWIHELRDEFSRWFLDFQDSVRVRAGVKPLRRGGRSKEDGGN